jgi:hypothetical protein
MAMDDLERSARKNFLCWVLEGLAENNFRITTEFDSLEEPSLVIVLTMEEIPTFLRVLSRVAETGIAMGVVSVDTVAATLRLTCAPGHSRTKA